MNKVIKNIFRTSTIVLSFVFSSFVFAETAVIVHPSNGVTLDQSAVNKLFLGKMKSFPGGGSAIPINQSASSPIRSVFDDGVLGKSSSQIKSYWAKILFTGKGTPPKEVDTDADVKGLVSSNPSTIGYIDASAVDDSVKVVFTF